MKKTFFSYSFGCRVNQAEKEALDRELFAQGYIFDQKNPQIYIINTCSVTHKAEREAKQMVYQVRSQFPQTKIVVTGCAATNWSKTRTQVNGVDLLVDNQNKEFMAQIIQKRIAEGECLSGRANTQFTAHVADVSNGKYESFHSQSPQNLSDTYHEKFLHSKRFILKIQDGCQRFCTYCIVPYLRGLPRSIPLEKIIEAIRMNQEDYREVILTAINTEAYGYDSPQFNFTQLVEAVLEKTSIARMSFGSVHPWSIHQDFFTLYQKYADSNRFVDFFHIPLQSGSNKMLNLMKRNYTREEFTEKLNILHQINPFAYIGTDVIVGYLEESDDDFRDTYSFLESTPISKFHVFRYSERQHTAASYMKKRLREPSAAEKKARAAALTQLSLKKYYTFLQKQIDRTSAALVLEKKTNNFQQALLHNQIPVSLKSNILEPGSIVSVRVTTLQNSQLFAEVVQ